MLVVDLDTVDPAAQPLVGGKAAGLARLRAAGERVPDGFCITTEATGLDDDLRGRIAAAYDRLGGGPVAVRSSATTEDLPQASVAGQHVTVCDVTGLGQLCTAVQQCWDSLHSDRAVAYRARLDLPEPRMAVVVQRMIPAAVSGVLFTANPLTGSRGEMTVDAAVGPGSRIVDGVVTGDHYVLAHAEAAAPAPHGCLTPPQLQQLRQVGRRLSQRMSAPQDVEWTIDGDGQLWLLQSRDITTVYPLPPATSRPGPRVYLNASHVQGMRRPFTPMGAALMMQAAAVAYEAFGMAEADRVGETMPVIGGRLFVDMTTFVRARAGRGGLVEGMRTQQGPTVAAGLAAVLEDPRFSPTRRLPVRPRGMARFLRRLGPSMTTGTIRALARPAAARARAHAAAARIMRVRGPGAGASAHERMRFVDTAHTRLFSTRVFEQMLWPLYAGLAAGKAPHALLSGLVAEGEVDAVLRGMPHNPTTDMDLALWRLAQQAGAHRELLTSTPPQQLAADYLRGRLPDLGLAAFLARYGHRAAAEVDVGMPRWREDPRPCSPRWPTTCA